MMITTRTTFRVLSIVLVLFFSISCTTNVKDTQSEASTSTYTAHVALSGGGWRAHTAHSGWTLSLLNNGKRTLSDAFANVGTVSSNSGGSWFSTMLMYSDDFVNAIEAPNAINTWSTTGWLGQQQSLFDATSCGGSGEAFLACVFNKYASALRWDTIVEGLVFKDYPISATLSGQRQPWAQDKPLLLAATMLTSQVVLNGSTAGDKQYYQACISPATPVLNGDKGASCSEGAAVDVTPVTFSSLPSGSSLLVPPFLPAIGSATNPLFNVGYTQNAWISPATATTTIQNPLVNNTVPVVIAAAASSAAGGFEASGVVSGDWLVSYEAEDEALSFQLSDSNVQFADASGLSVQDLADQNFVRIADGGPVDNSGVAQLVSFLQLNDQADGFNIVAFDNVQELYIPSNSGAARIGIDLANLFNAGVCSGNQFCSGLNCDGTCVTTPKVQIFDADAVQNTPATWSVSTGASGLTQGLIYTKYTVTTVDNASFGITAGTTGTLHAFTCVWSNADTAPQNKHKDEDFDAYAAMLSFINTGLQQQKGTGLQYLEAALGISQ